MESPESQRNTYNLVLAKLVPDTLLYVNDMPFSREFQVLLFFRLR